MLALRSMLDMSRGSAWTLMSRSGWAGTSRGSPSPSEVNIDARKRANSRRSAGDNGRMTSLMAVGCADVGAMAINASALADESFMTISPPGRPMPAPSSTTTMGPPESLTSRSWTGISRGAASSTSI